MKSQYDVHVAILLGRHVGQFSVGQSRTDEYDEIFLLSGMYWRRVWDLAAVRHERADNVSTA